MLLLRTPKTPVLLAAALALLAIHSFPSASAQSETEANPGLPLIDLSSEGAAMRFVPSSGQVSVAPDNNAGNVSVKIQPGKESYPGISLQPEGEKYWDLSPYGHVEAEVVNTGETAISVSLRVDNKSDGSQSNTESVRIKPGETGTVQVIFGYAYGRKPSYPLKPSEVGNLLLFTGKNKNPQSFRIESIKAAGSAGEKPPVDPKSIRIVPEDGVLLGEGVAIDAEKQIAAGTSAQAVAEGGALKISFPPGKTGRSVALKPAAGRWDLREALEVKVKLKNEGQTPVTPKIQVDSNKGPTAAVAAPAPLAPGAEEEITVSFIPTVPWEGPKEFKHSHQEGEPGTGTKFVSDAVSAVKIIAGPESGPQSLLVTSITVGVPPAPEMPDWLGKRPPVEGNWVLTFDEEFEGDAIDQSKWSYYTPNYWDKRSHFSKDNVIVANGTATLRYEKKTGFHGDDPSGKQTNYATGVLESYGKWVQRYGYFEARMKLPTAPGLWPAFWLMPDRGAAVGPQWKRADTGKGGMEFDIMEFLSRWGPYRYNIAMHWDGYGKGHKATGSTCTYFRPDKDGFITAGLLWLPELAVFYANGQEVARWKNPRISNVPSNLLFTNVSGGWDNSPIDDSKLPDDFVIDYVRAWQRKDLASAADGPQAQPTPAPTPEAAQQP